MFKRLLKEPLLHFFVAGLLLFAAFDVVSKDRPGDSSMRIVVDREALLTFMQHRSKFFDPGRFEDALDNLSEADLQALIDDYALEEALYREAKALRLDELDYGLRQGLIRKLGFINQGVISSTIRLTESELESYMAANEARYYVGAKTTFTHVFFNADIHGFEEAQALAGAELKLLSETRVPFHEAISHGDRFLYHRNYVNKEADEIASHFGPNMQEHVFALDADDTAWHGPFRSEYGFHLVMVTKQTPGYLSPLAEVRGRVEMDAAQDRLQDEMDKINRAIVESYQIEIVDIRGGESAGDMTE